MSSHLSYVTFDMTGIEMLRDSEEVQSSATTDNTGDSLLVCSEQETSLKTDLSGGEEAIPASGNAVKNLLLFVYNEEEEDQDKLIENEEVQSTATSDGVRDRWPYVYDEPAILVVGWSAPDSQSGSPSDMSVPPFPYMYGRFSHSFNAPAMYGYDSNSCAMHGHDLSFPAMGQGPPFYNAPAMYGQDPTTSNVPAMHHHDPFFCISANGQHGPDSSKFYNGRGTFQLVGQDKLAF